MKLSQRILTNTIALSTSHIICRILSFVLVLAIARKYSTESFGKYTFALSFIELFMILSDLGLTKIIVRDVARNTKDSGKLLGSLGTIKVCYSIVTFLLIGLALYASNYPIDVIKITFIFGFRSLFDSFYGFFASVIKGHQQMKFIPPFDIGGILITVSAGFVVLNLDMDILVVALVFMCSSFIKMSSLFILLLAKFCKPIFQLNFLELFSYAKRAIPFGLGSIFVRIFTRIDTVMLSKLTTMTIVGYYNAAYNIILVLLFLPGAFNEAIYPVMSRFFSTSERDHQKIFERSFKYSMLMGIPMATGIFVLADKFILLFYGSKYSFSIVNLQILCWVLALSFGNFIFTTTLNSANREKHVTFAVFVCSIVNIILNIFFIPRWEHIGASVATVITEVVFISLSIYYVHRHIFSVKVIKYLPKPILGSVVMYFLISYLKGWALYYLLPIGIISYITTIFALRTFDSVDIDLINKIIRKKQIQSE